MHRQQLVKNVYDRCVTDKGFCTSVRSDVNLQMSLLVEALGAIRHAALVPFPWFLTVLGLFILLR
jgi:hypothetical protein